MKNSVRWFIIVGAIAGATILGLPEFLTARTNGNPFEIASLVVAVLTLEATVLIAVFIYDLQQKDTEKTATKQEVGAKKILYTELSSGLETVIRAPWSGGAGDMSSQLSQLLIAYLPYIQESFEPEQLHHLLQLVDVMSSTAKQAATEDSAAAAEFIQSWLGLFVEKRFIPAMRSQYSDQFIRLDDYRRVLTPLTRTVLEILSGDSLPPAAENRLMALDGSPLLEVAPNGYTRIYDVAGELLCNALLDEAALGGYGIEAGWAKTKLYVGEFKNGQRHGQGCSYSLWKQHKMFDGRWEDNEPKVGKQFNLVFEQKLDGWYEYLFPYWDEYHILSHHVTDYLTKRDELTPKQVLARLYIAEKVWIDDEHSFQDMDVFYPLADFMEKHDPDNFSRLEELNHMFDCDEEEDLFIT